jgi:hypothetical protein
MESDYFIPWREDTKFINNAMRHIINKFKLKPALKFAIRFDIVPLNYYFVKKNTNRYFKKHLGFTYTYVPDGTLIKVVDNKKFMLFKLQYEI